MVRRLAGGFCVVLLAGALVAQGEAALCLAGERAIPPGAETRVLSLLSPYGVEAPADDLGGGVTLTSVQIEGERIRLTLSAQGTAAVLVLTQRGNSPGVLDRSASFDLSWEGETSGALAEAGSRVAGAVRRNDRGGFWSEMPQKQPVTAPPDTTLGLAWFDFVGEAIIAALLLLVALSFRLWKGLMGGRLRWWLPAGLAFCLAVGLSYRLVLDPATGAVSSEPSRTDACSADVHCDDFRACTADRCVDQKCFWEWLPPEGVDCCLEDADCPQPGERCLESFCNQETGLCATRGSRECSADPYEGQGRPPMHSSLGWLLATPAKHTGNDATLATRVNLAFSVLAALLLFLAMLAWGATPAASLWAGFLYSVLPASMVAAQTPSMTGVLLALGLFLFAVLARLGQPDLDRRTRLSGALLLLLLYLLVSFARPEGVLLAVPAAVYLLTGGRLRGWNRPELLLLAGGGLMIGAGALLVQLVLYPADYLPPFVGPGLGSAMTALDVLFLEGLVMPFLMVLLALCGIPAAMRESRPLGIGLVGLFLAVPVQVLLFRLEGSEAVRYGLIPLVSVAALGGFGLRSVAAHRAKLAWLAALILVVYFLMFPLSRLPQLRELTESPTIISQFIQI